ncbi:hypothetical protein QOZ80_9AG0675170 [Eleusine coracana subsp. coracana]|nr:hypothetical protein QOZ80_9AG0675170 [Eleusine coracana subsp. coracana]
MTPAYAEELKRAGNDQYKKGCFEEALRLYDRALAICPDNAACRGNRAAALTGLCRFGEAVKDCEEALRINPSYGRAHQRLTSLHVRLGHIEDALKHLSLASPQPDPSELHKLQTVEKHVRSVLDARKAGEWKTVLRESDAAIASGADSSALLLAAKAEALLPLNLLDEAHSTISSASKLDYTYSCSSETKFCGFLANAYLFYVHAQVDMALGRFHDAVSSIDKARIKDPGNTEVVTMHNKVKAVARARSLGNELFNSGKFSEACLAYGEGLKQHPTNKVLYCNRAACWFKLGQWEKSIQDCNEALKIYPNYTKASLRRAASYAKMGEWEEGPHDVTAQAQDRVNLADGPNIGNLQKSSEVCPRCRCNTEDIDESSAEGLCGAVSYAKANAMLIQIPVLGTTKKFWRLSDKATRISRKLALILKSHHAVCKYLAAPLQVSNVLISDTGIVKLRGVSFTSIHFSIERLRDDYKHLSRVLLVLISISGGDITKLPPDYEEFIMLLRRTTLTVQDEFLIVNNSALLPMKNRTDVFLMLCDKINKYLGRTKDGQEKRRRIISKLPYEKDWLDTAVANTQINQWVVNVQNKYERTQYDQLRLNRNVRSHMHDYNDDDIEEILYCEWPELLMEMVKALHAEGELECTDIQNKFG